MSRLAAAQVQAAPGAAMALAQAASAHHTGDVMGLLIDGKWTAQGHDTSATGGPFVRQATSFRNSITLDGAPGPTGRGGCTAEAGRDQLHVSLACPCELPPFLAR